MDEFDYSIEEWRKVVGYEGVYSVSNLGRVRRDKPYRSTVAGYILEQRLLRRYPSVILCNKSARNICVHRLVANAFLGTCPDGYQVNHIDGSKLNNRVDNLEYVTPKENTRHAIRMGLRKQDASNLPHYRGTEHPRNTYMTDEMVAQIKLMAQQNIRQAIMLRALGFSTAGQRAAVSSVVRGLSWKHIKPALTLADSIVVFLEAHTVTETR